MTRPTRIAGVEAIGGLVVVDAGRDLGQLRQAQDGRHQQGQGHEGQGVMAAAGAGLADHKFGF